MLCRVAIIDKRVNLVGVNFLPRGIDACPYWSAPETTDTEVSPNFFCSVSVGPKYLIPVPASVHGRFWPKAVIERPLHKQLPHESRSRLDHHDAVTT